MYIQGLEQFDELATWKVKMMHRQFYQTHLAFCNELDIILKSSVHVEFVIAGNAAEQNSSSSASDSSWKDGDSVCFFTVGAFVFILNE